MQCPGIAPPHSIIISSYFLPEPVGPPRPLAIILLFTRYCTLATAHALLHTRYCIASITPIAPIGAQMETAVT